MRVLVHLKLDFTHHQETNIQISLYLLIIDLFVHLFVYLWVRIMVFNVTFNNISVLKNKRTQLHGRNSS
jgi:flagellar biogenesis protein FliO